MIQITIPQELADKIRQKAKKAKLTPEEMALLMLQWQVENNK